MRKLCANPELAKSTVEEVVRWTSPVNYMKRHLLEDVEVAGVKMQAGEDLIMYYASANRDAEVFERVRVLRRLHKVPHHGHDVGAVAGNHRPRGGQRADDAGAQVAVERA